ncbi:hypothetical protein BPY_07020 [Bifidobacterium psychraerophilum]|uniref:hypothetical protein n=1 Tax=Bifidobacterium psychraerophilum TaxID=218140 RepID=UPI0031119884
MTKRYISPQSGPVDVKTDKDSHMPRTGHTEAAGRQNEVVARLLKSFIINEIGSRIPFRCAVQTFDAAGNGCPCDRPAAAVKYWRGERYPYQDGDCVDWVCKQHVNSSQPDEIIPIQEVIREFTTATESEEA